MFNSIVTPEGRDGWPHRNGRIFGKVQIGLKELKKIIREIVVEEIEKKNFK